MYKSDLLKKKSIVSLIKEAPTKDWRTLLACDVMSFIFSTTSTNPHIGSWYLIGWARQGQQAFIEKVRWVSDVRSAWYSKPKLVVQITQRLTCIFMNSWIKTTREKTTKKHHRIYHIKDKVNYTLRRNLHIKGIRQFFLKTITFYHHFNL